MMETLWSAVWPILAVVSSAASMAAVIFYLVRVGRREPAPPRVDPKSERMRRNECPYCEKRFRMARIRKQKTVLLAVLCPEKHSGFLLEMGPRGEDGRQVVGYKQLDYGGAPMQIPDAWIQWGPTLPDTTKRRAQRDIS